MAIHDLIPWKWGERKMPVRRAEAADPMATMQQEMERMVDHFFGHHIGLAPGAGLNEPLSVFSPNIDVIETDQYIKITAELPGLAEQDIEVTLSSAGLTLSGEKKAEKEDKDQNYYRLERTYGSFQRTIPLPESIDADKVEAMFKNGILQITLPKLQAGPDVKKKVPIQAR